MAGHARGAPLSPRRGDIGRIDEDDVRIRPGRGSGPRTRTRPPHADAEEGLVTAVDRGRIRCRLGGRSDGRDVTAMRARELGRRGVAVGDRVWLVGETSGTTDTLARIVRLAPRSTVLRRTADDSDPVERVMVANADQLVVVVAVADPPPRTGLIDRCLIAALAAGITPVLCLTKTDLAADSGELVRRYAGLDLPTVHTRRDVEPAELRARLLGKMTVLVGHSGVGKSTVVNRLVPGSDRRTGEVNEVTGRGRHTSSSAVALPLGSADTDGWVIDTPGVRSFGLAHVRPEDILAPFDVLTRAVPDCPSGCRHTVDAAGCALDAAAALAGPVATAQLESVRHLLAGRQPG